MPAHLVAHAFDPAAMQKKFESAQATGSFGASASFTGTMRRMNEGDAVVAMELEHYPEMTQPQLERICEEARERFDILDALIVHRVGHVEPGDVIVLTAVVSAHRKAAFDACRYLMEELKSRATFWKKELLEDGSKRWVERNTPG